MIPRNITKVVLIVCCFISACNPGPQAEIKSTADKRAAEISKRNPLKKGRYQCIEIAAGKEKEIAPLYILSDELYQYKNVVGKYSVDKDSLRIHWLSGLFYEPSAPWIGSFSEQATVVSAFLLHKKSSRTAQENDVAIRCTWTEFQY